MGHRAKWIALVTVLVVLLAAACGAKPSSTTATPSTSTTAQTVAGRSLTTQRATELSNELHSGTEAGVAAAVAVPKGQQIDSSAITALAALRVAFERSTFKSLGNGTASITVTVTSSSGTQDWNVI